MLQTKEFLKALFEKYPDMQLSDCFKALYQSVFGCAHLVADVSAAAKYIQTEAQENTAYIDSKILPLDGDFCRVSLSLLSEGMSADTFAKLFALSAEMPIGDNALLKQKLICLQELVQSGELPFSPEQTAHEIEVWKKKGFPALHHSEHYRQQYHPAYRLLHRKYIPYLPIFTQIDQIFAKQGHVVVAIEGGSASGKTTLSELLQKVYGAACNVFHMDDFFLQAHQRTEKRLSEIGGNVDYERFLSEVMQPLTASEAVQYRRFDCQTFTIQPTVHMQPKAINIVEGAYSMHPTLCSFYDFSVFLKISPALQKKRIEKRNTPIMQEKFFNIWIPMENRYFEKYDLASRCTLTLEVLDE